MNAPIKSILFLAMALLTAGAALGQDAPRILNGSEPANGLVVMKLQELWRVGGEEDDESVFGQIVRVLGDDQGRTYVLDGQLAQATVYDQGGELVATLFGQGEGPGELRYAMDLVFLPGGTIGAVSRYPGGVVAVDRDGTPAESIQLSVPGRSFLAAAQRDGHLVVAESANEDHDDGTHTKQSILGAVAPDGTRTTIYLQRDWHVDYRNNFVFDERKTLVDYLFSFDVGPGGLVYALADADRYAISVFAPDGTLLRTIEREFTPRKRTDAELASIKALTERRYRTFPFDISYVYAENEAVIPWYLRGLQVTDDGRLWVRQTGNDDLARRNGALVVFDVFSPEGEFTEQIAVQVPGNAARDGVFLIGDDRLVVVHGFVDAMLTMVGGGRGGMQDDGAEPEPIEVVCYRIEPLQP